MRVPLLFIVIALLSGCNFASNTDEMIESLSDCKAKFKEDCSFIPVPNSAEVEVGNMYESLGLKRIKAKNVNGES